MFDDMKNISILFPVQLNAKSKYQIFVFSVI